MDDKALGLAVAVFRRRRKWTQADLAKRVHYSRSSISRLEMGDFTQVQLLIRSLDVLGWRIVIKDKYGEGTYEGQS